MSPALDDLEGGHVLPTVEDTEAFGERLGRMLSPGDLVVLTGPLGAGKTTLTRGIAAGLGVRGPVQSPTFVLARTHPSLVGGPASMAYVPEEPEASCAAIYGSSCCLEGGLADAPPAETEPEPGPAAPAPVVAE